MLDRTRKGLQRRSKLEGLRAPKASEGAVAGRPPVKLMAYPRPLIPILIAVYGGSLASVSRKL